MLQKDGKEFSVASASVFFNVMILDVFLDENEKFTLITHKQIIANDTKLNNKFFIQVYFKFLLYKSTNKTKQNKL